MLDHTKMRILLLEQYMECSFQWINNSIYVRSTCVFGIDAILRNKSWILYVILLYLYKYEFNRLCIRLYSTIYVFCVLCLLFKFVDLERGCLNWNSYAIKMVIFYNNNHNNSMVCAMCVSSAYTRVRNSHCECDAGVENIVHASCQLYVPWIPI